MNRNFSRIGALRVTVLTLGALVLSAPFLASNAMDEKTGKPDLVVTTVGVLESENHIGTDAHLIARIENHGDLATKKDVIHGVAFYVDNEFVAWSDTYRQDLKPGQFAILRSNGGPNGSATWKVMPGKHTIRAVVDDAKRFDESNEENNSLEAALEWKAPLAMNSDTRTEFGDVSLEIYDRLRSIQNAGLFQAATIPTMHARPISPYETAVALARLQDAFPTLAGDDKAQRLKTIDAATAGAGHKLSSTEVEALDADIRGLQTDFSDELQKLNSKLQRSNSRGSVPEVR